MQMRTGDFAEDAGPDVMEAVAQNCAKLTFNDEAVHLKVHAQTLLKLSKV